MNPRIVLAIAKKDIVDVLKNKNTLMALATPLVMAVFFVFLANLLNSNTDIVRTVRYYDPENSGVVAAVNQYFGGELEVSAGNSREEVRDAVARKDAIFGIAVPAGYVAGVKSGARPQVEVFFDSSKADASTAGRISQGIQAHAMQLAGISIPSTVQVEALNQPTETNMADFNLSNFYSLFALITAVISCGLYIMPNLLVEEKEKKTLRSLIVSPASFKEIVAAKLLVGLLYTALVSILVALINLPPLDALGKIVLGVILAALFFNLVGLFIGSISEQMTTANAYIGGVFFIAFFPMMLVMMPFINAREGALGVVMHLIPTFYFADLFRMSLLASPDMAQFGLNIAVCIALIAALASLSIWSLRRQRV